MNRARTRVPRRILVVEDNLDSMQSLVHLLRDLGHEVDFAINGHAAIEVAERMRPDFVLLDLGLPGFDGYYVCRRLKGTARLKDTRIVAITGYASEESRARSKAAGCELHFAKPVDLHTLAAVLESARPDPVAAQPAASALPSPLGMEGFLRSTLYPFNRAFLEKAPEEAGIFGLFDGDELVYVGRAEGGEHSIKAGLLLHPHGGLGACTRKATHYAWEITASPAAREEEVLAQFRRQHRREPRCNKLPADALSPQRYSD